MINDVDKIENQIQITKKKKKSKHKYQITHINTHTDRPLSHINNLEPEVDQIY